MEETPKFTVGKIHNHPELFEEWARFSMRGALRMRNKHNVGEWNGRSYLEDIDIDGREVLKLSFMGRTALLQVLHLVHK
jgi:hypothetical protein